MCLAWRIHSTLRRQVLEMAKDFMKQPFRLLVKREDLSLQGIRQYYVSVEKDRVRKQKHLFVSRSKPENASCCSVCCPGRVEVRHSVRYL